jgi:hypothetical protein
MRDRQWEISELQFRPTVRQPLQKLVSKRKGIDMKASKPDSDGNEPAPLMLIAVAVLPLFAAIGWFVFG